MSIRVSSNQMIYGYQKQLNAANTRQNVLLEQGDGSKIHRPSDNPVDYTKYLRYQSSLGENEQYTNNVNTALSWMKTADTALVNVTNILTTFKEKAILAANSTNNGTDMQAIAKEMMAEIQEVVSLGNTMHGDRYVFGGQSTLVRPFELNIEEMVRGMTKTLDETQAAFFNESDSSGTVTQFLVMEDVNNPENLYYLETTTGRVYTKDFVDNGYKDKRANGQNVVSYADSPAKYQSSDYSQYNVTATDYMNAGYIPSTTHTYTVLHDDGTSETITTDFSAYTVVKDANGEMGYAKPDDGTVYKFENGKAPEVLGKYPGSGDFQAIAFTTNDGTTYATDGAYYRIKDDADNVYFAHKDSGAICASASSLESDFSETNISGGQVIGDLYASNQRYKWSSPAATMTVNGQLYIGVTDVNDQETPPTVYYYDKDTRKIYKQDYLQEVQSSGDTVNEGKSIGNMKAFYIAANFNQNGKLLDENDSSNLNNAGVNYETNITDSEGRNVTLRLATIKQQMVSYSGDADHISMIKKNGPAEPTADTVNVAGTQIFGTDLFDNSNSGNAASGVSVINMMLMVYSKVAAEDQLWMSTDGVELADKAHAQVVKIQTQMGARTQLYQSASTMLNNQNELITADITNTSSTDVAKLAVQLMQEQAIFNMSLSLGARILPQSLADYL